MYTYEDRDSCPSGTDIDNMDLWCVNPDEDCEQVKSNAEMDFFLGLIVQPWYAVIGMLIANLIQFLYLLLIIFIMQMKVQNIDEIKRNFKKCGLQILLILWSLASLIAAGYFVGIICLKGRWKMFVGTVLAAFILDQVKAFFFHMGIWYFLIRKCGYLKINEDQYI